MIHVKANISIRKHAIFLPFLILTKSWFSIRKSANGVFHQPFKFVSLAKNYGM